MDDARRPERDDVARTLRELLHRIERLERRLGIESPPQAGAPSHPSENKVVVLTPRAKADLESRIGSQWLNRIGIIAVLFGVAFFLKYAFENRWIGAGGRVSLGVLGGIAILLWSARFRLRGYRVFSFSLKAVAIGVLYLSFWAAFQLYRLFPLGIAFFAMVLVTATTAVLALVEEAEVLALFALIGGFATPLLLYTGQNREAELFVYVALLDSAVATLAILRHWWRLLLAGLAGTVVLHFAWYVVFYRPAALAMTIAFATLFFLIFAGTSIGAASPGRPGSRALFAVALINAAAFFLEMYLVLEPQGRDWTALCALLLAGFYAWLAWEFPRGGALDYLHSALAVGFVTAAIALRFESQWITILWFVEAALLMAAGFWRRSSATRWQALVVLALAILKVFAYDIWQLGRGYRIVSFVALGVLLLVISFLYQKNWLPKTSVLRMNADDR